MLKLPKPPAAEVKGPGAGVLAMELGPMLNVDGGSIGDGNAESATTAAPDRGPPQRRQLMFLAKL